jgi:ATP-dependent Clp protease adaptor protein ClpS
VSAEDNTAVLEPPVIIRPQRRPQHHRQIERNPPPRPPRYHVILWNDDDHSYAYVQKMLLTLFGMPLEVGYQIAERVDTTGRAICLTTTREHAELKVEQIHAFGADPGNPRCKGSMSATLEPERA